MLGSQNHHADLAATMAPGPLSAALKHLWGALRLVALWGNLIYAVSLLVTVGVLVGLDPAPWRAHANVLLVLSIAGATPLLNVRAARTGLSLAPSALAVVLNLACFAYFVFKPEYSIPVFMVLVALVPVLNIVVIVSKCTALVRQVRAESQGDA